MVTVTMKLYELVVGMDVDVTSTHAQPPWSTIVATALPRIVGDLHGFSHLSWVITAYFRTPSLRPRSG